MTFQEWADSLPEDERKTLCPADAWRAALEEAAALCDAYQWWDDTLEPRRSDDEGHIGCAAAIRALKNA